MLFGLQLFKRITVGIHKNFVFFATQSEQDDPDGNAFDLQAGYSEGTQC
jgi:hypothetical protein